MQIVYILGTTRSGTSAIRNAIAQTRFKGFGEGHTVGILADFLKSVRKAKSEGQGADVAGTALFALQEHVFLRHVFFAYERYFEKTLGSSYIVDKTPNIIPIYLAPDLAKFHKDAKFIYCSRRHVDNIKSKIKKFPNQGFSSMCREWVGCNETWLKVQDDLGDRCLSFDFFELVTEQRLVSEKMGDLLDIDQAEVSAICKYLSNERPEATAGHDLMTHSKFSELDWEDEEKEVFLDICGPLGRKMGYGLEAYYEP